MSENRPPSFAEVLAAAGAIATAPDLGALPDALCALWRRL